MLPCFHKLMTKGLAVALMLSATEGAFADAVADAKAEFDKTYGVALRGVKGTRSTADDAKLAIILLEAAQNNANSQAYTLLLLDQTYELGKLHTDGMKAAADALQQIANIVPRRQLESQEKLLSLYEIVFRNAAGKSDKSLHKKAGTATTDLIVEIAQAKRKRAEYVSAIQLLNKAMGISRSVAYSDKHGDIRNLIDEMTPLAPIDLKIQSARRALTRNPADKDAARTLTDLYLKDLDRPVSAKTYATIIEPKATVDLMELAGQPVQSLSSEEAAKLAAWYVTLAQEGSTNAKTNMLIRAKVYYARALTEKPDDAEAKAGATKVALMLTTLKIDPKKSDELADSRRDRLGIAIASATPVKPSPEVAPPMPKPLPKPDPKDEPKAKPDPEPEPEEPPAMIEPVPTEVESEFREEVLPDSYWKNRKSIFDF